MANNTNQDVDELDDEGFDYAPAPPPPPPPPTQPIAPAAVSPPVAPRIDPGDLPRALRPPVMPPAFNLEQWREQNAEMPIAQAEQAVASAMRFQGIRQYQQDLASGMNASEALAKNAPMLFGGPKQNLGNVASFLRATRPPTTQYRDIGGVLYEIEPGKRPVPISQKTPGFANIGPTIQRINKLTEELKDTRTPQEVRQGVPDPGFGILADEKRAQINALRQQLQRAQGPTPQRVVPPTLPAGPAATPVPAPEGPQRITTKEQYDQLASGTVYIGKDGRRYRKP